MCKYEWKRDNYAGFTCKLPGNVTLIASPCRTVSRGLRLQAAPKSMWRAQASIWEDSTRTMSRYGRDAWREECGDAKAAKLLAQNIYEETVDAAISF